MNFLNKIYFVNVYIKIFVFFELDRNHAVYDNDKMTSKIM
jgi:hypothetical protein